MQICGSLYQRNERWWWRVRLPGEKKHKNIPLKPVGAKFATKDKKLAVEVAKMYWHKATMEKNCNVERVKTIADLVKAYIAYARQYYRRPDGTNTSEVGNVENTTRMLVEQYGRERPDEFGPLKLKELRNEMINCGWCRGVINQRTGIIKRMFAWAVSEQLVSPYVVQALSTVSGLRKGRTEAKESKPVKPVGEENVRKVLPYASDTVAAMMELQLYTGMRSGQSHEILI